MTTWSGWLVFLGNGDYSHAVTARGAERTLCGRSTASAREWVPPPVGDPGCKVCFRIVETEASATSED